MERKVSTKKYLLAFILTLIIFAGGIGMGILFENVRLSHSEEAILQEKVSLRSLQLQQNYIDSGLANCKTLNTILENNINELGGKMAEVINFEKNAIFGEEEFNLQLQDYFLTEIQYLLISQEIDKKCTRENVKVVYFYGEDSRDNQGDVLDYLKKLFGNNVLVFSLNGNFQQEPMINILLTSHNITQFPSVVVEDKVLSGHSSVEVLMKEICNSFGKIDQIKPKQCGSSIFKKNIISPILQ